MLCCIDKRTRDAVKVVVLRCISRYLDNAQPVDRPDVIHILLLLIQATLEMASALSTIQNLPP